MTVPHGLVKGVVTGRINWTPQLFTIQVQTDINPYVAG